MSTSTSNNNDTTNITEIDLSGKNLTTLPEDILSYTQIQKLNAGNNKLHDLPINLHFTWPYLRILFFLNNQFTCIPKVIAKLSNLFMLSFKSCLLTTIPENAFPAELVWLILTDNKISSLPSNFSYELSNVRKLMLASNELTILPNMKGFQQLELVRLSDNHLSDVSPTTLLQLPKLAWLALGGNPCTNIEKYRKFTENSTSSITIHTLKNKSMQLTTLPSLPRIPYKDIELGKELGQGASGTVYKGIWKQTIENTSTTTINSKLVAIKLFKPASSDGKPEDEIDVALLCSQYGLIDSNINNSTNTQAYQHPNFIHINGYINELSTENNNSSKILGLVLEYLPSTDELPDEGWTILARPPSFNTVTRDTFPIISSSVINPPYTINFIYNICKGICSILQLFHAIQIVHGDVYAHNVMVQKDGTPKLGDLGAAFIYPYETSTLSGSKSIIGWEYLEVRGYGCLIDDLLLQSIEYNDNKKETNYVGSNQYQFLSSLRDQCMNLSPSLRPSFSLIMDQFINYENK